MDKSGHFDALFGAKMIGEFADRDVCASCRSAVWTLSIPFKIALDPEPLLARGEYEAIKSGRRTYRCVPFMDSFWAIWRSFSDIEFCSRPGQIILASHIHRFVPARVLPDYWNRVREFSTPPLGNEAPF